MVDPTKTFQAIEGFGGALTDAAAETFAKLPKERQRELLTAYFDPREGHRLHPGPHPHQQLRLLERELRLRRARATPSCSTSASRHDRRFRLPFIRAALATAGGPVKVFASPWSPPAWMKTNDNMLQGGKLKPEYREAWARYYVRFIQEYGKEGVPIWGLTVQNEPMATQTWESCLFTGEEERDFVRDHLGPALEQAGLQRLKLMVWDHNRGILYQRAKAVYDDPAAARYVWGAGFHWYVGDHFDNVRMVHDAWPDKQPALHRGHAGRTTTGATSSEWKWGEVYATSILRDVRTGPRAGPTGTCSSTRGAARTTSATSASPPCTATPAPGSSPSRAPTTTSATSRSSCGRARGASPRPRTTTTSWRAPS